MNLPLINQKSSPFYLQEVTLKDLLNKSTITADIIIKVSVEPKTESLSPSDEKSKYLQKVVQRLFPDIRIQTHSLLICQHIYAKTYSVFFINSKIVPFSYCCHEPLTIKCFPIGFGLFLCSNPKCPKPELKAFKFSDSDPRSEEVINQQLSKLITVGRHKQLNLIKTKQKIGLELLQREHFSTEPFEVNRKVKARSLHTRIAKNLLKRAYQIS